MTRKTCIVLLFVNAGILGGLVALNLVIVPPRIEVVGVPLARMGAVVGQVEVKKTGTSKWAPARVGQVLVEGDEIRTALFSEVIMHLRGNSSVVVSANTDFVIGKDLVASSSFELGVGQITAAISQGKDQAYEFHSRGSDAVATAQQGEFSMATDGEGTVVVDAREGDVKLSAKGREVTLRKGRRSVVLPNKPPSRVLPIPSSVALQVKWPPTKLDKTRTRITGTTAAGAMVLVNGILVRADQNGKFTLDVPLRQGSNRLVVNATDSVGNSSTRESPEIRVDTRPPGLKVDAKDLWK